MGLFESKPEYSILIPYMAIFSDGPLSVDPTVEIEVKASTLASEFIEGKNKGLFASKFIPKDTIIAQVNMSEPCIMNDGLVNLKPILQAQNSREFYEAWKYIKESYYDVNKAEQMINIVMVGDPNSPNTFYKA